MHEQERVASYRKKMNTESNSDTFDHDKSRVTRQHYRYPILNEKSRVAVLHQKSDKLTQVEHKKWWI